MLRDGQGAVRQTASPSPAIEIRRASPELSQTPSIMITAESKTENVIAAKKAGVNNYIVKPFNAATLRTRMEAVFPGSAE
jgi:two-component system chemotaxis response regulator CheY